MPAVLIVQARRSWGVKYMANNKLTPKQAKFIDEYLIDLNATQAAIRAGYSKRTAQRIGSENLSKPVIIAELQRKREQLAKERDITPQKVLAEYCKLAFLDPRAFYDKKGNLLSIHELPADVAAALTGMDISSLASKDGEFETVRKIKFSDKRAALDSIAKHLGMFVDKTEVEGELTLKVVYDEPPKTQEVD